MDNYLSVAQVNSYIKGIFDNELLLKGICVYGEVSSYSISNGIAYFNLKDGDNLLPCVLFGAAKFDKPNLGDMVLVRGSVSYYNKGGKLSFNAVSISPYGKGVLYEKFLKLKAELEAQGYFDVAHKKPIPDRVKRIGVVTSATGAVIQDIIDVTTRRNNGIDIVLYPVKVQGVGAEVEIANGINFFSTYPNVDVVIVARGGGSMEDLEPFNTIEVAKATYNCQKPIVSAVGHETDYTIIDFVSDLRAPTPSAAAELVAWDKAGVQRDILSYLQRISTNIYNKVKYVGSTIDGQYLTMYNMICQLLLTNGHVVDNCLQSMSNAIDNMHIDNFNQVTLLDGLINKLNPSSVIKRGYAKVLSKGAAVTGAAQLCVNDDVEIQLLDGNIYAHVVNVVKR